MPGWVKWLEKVMKTRPTGISLTTKNRMVLKGFSRYGFLPSKRKEYDQSEETKWELEARLSETIPYYFYSSAINTRYFGWIKGDESFGVISLFQQNSSAVWRRRAVSIEMLKVRRDISIPSTTYYSVALYARAQRNHHFFVLHISLFGGESSRKRNIYQATRNPFKLR